MTSTEFAAKYRLLKNVATRGARSFLAQQVELGRMVMVHYLDAEPAKQRGDAVARLRAMDRPGRDKLLELIDVDGSPVAVTLFISSFSDFTTWLDQVAPPLPAPAVADQPSATPPAPAIPSAPAPPVASDRTFGDFTREFGGIAAPQMTPPSVATPADTAPQTAPSLGASSGGSDFTRLFGKIESGKAESVGAPRSAPSAPAASAEDDAMAVTRSEVAVDAPTLIIEALRPPVTEAPQPQATEPPHPPVAAAVPPPVAVESAAASPPQITPAFAAPPLPTPEPPHRQPSAEEPSFTAIFGAASAGAAPSPSFSAPLPAPSPVAARVIPPPFAVEPERPAPPPVAPPAPAESAGEFTQLFQRLNTAGRPSPSGFPDVARPFDATPRADLPPGAPPAAGAPAPSFGLPSQPPGFAPTPAPVFGGAAAPPSIVQPPTPSFGAAQTPLPSATPGAAPPTPLPAVNTVPQSDPGLSGAGARAWGSPTGLNSSTPSEFTRILGRVPFPVPGASATPTPSAPTESSAPSPGEPRRPKSYLPLIVALNLVAVATIAMVVYFMLKR